MQRLAWIGASLLLLVGCRNAPPGRNAPSAPDPYSEETRTIARDFMHLQYEEKNLKGAKAKYYTPDFIQHNPEIASGVHGDQKFIDARQQRDPVHYLPIEQWVNKIDHVLVDGKYFAIHHRLYTSPQDRGRVFLDIWRVENGKMVEHWDVIQGIPEEAKNANSMCGDLSAGGAPAPDDPSPEAVIRGYLDVGLAQNNPGAAAEKYIADDFRQHSPHIADGKSALVEYFKSRTADPNSPARSSYVSHILSDADLVLVLRHVVNGPEDRGVMYADLFRVRRGKIVEHWDVIQAVPEKSVNGNTMW